MDRMKYTLREASPYCWLDVSDLSKVRSWVVYADGFGFTVAGFGTTRREARAGCREYAERLATDPAYRETRRAQWFPNEKGVPSTSCAA